ncbi:MAG TPA: hypothetical protein EYG88_02875 [Desulfocapsa sulfexigens]|nr:hypothetical protein [Desulfocapsa sulfexigens]
MRINKRMVTGKKNLALLVALSLLLLNGCVPDLSPSLSEAEKRTFEDNKYPFAQSTIYANALEQMGTVINETVSYRKIIQPMNIGNTAGGSELPYNLTNMVINSVSEFAGPRIVVVPYDPNYIINDAQTGGKGTRVLPDLLIGGSITEFDKDIEGNSSSVNLDMLISHQGTEADIGLGAGKSKKLSRVVLDLYLLDYATHAVIPGVNVSNTVHVLELDKDHDFGFAIWGSGMGIEGRIERKQGFHKAVRNLVEYSILQLFGKYYDLPYWRLLSMEQADRDVMRSLNKTFLLKTRTQQIYDIQKWLARYNLSSVVNPIDGKKYYQVPKDGVLSPLTQTYIEKYIEYYAPSIESSNLPGIYSSLVENGAFPGTNPVRSPADVAAAHKALSDKMGKSKESTNLILMRQ